MPPPTAPRSMTRDEYELEVAKRMTEAVLLDRVRDLARVFGWLTYHTHRSDRSEPGFPDLVLAHPAKRRLIFAELKRHNGRTTPPQEIWLDALREVADVAEDHVAAMAAEPADVIVVHLWRPADLLDGSIEGALR